MPRDKKDLEGLLRDGLTEQRMDLVGQQFTKLKSLTHASVLSEPYAVMRATQLIFRFPVICLVQSFDIVFNNRCGLYPHAL